MLKLSLAEPSARFIAVPYSDELNELSPIEFGLRSYFREFNHKVILSDGHKLFNLELEPDLFCNVESFPTIYYRILNRKEGVFHFASTPLLSLDVEVRDEKFYCSANWMIEDQTLTAEQFKELILGFAKTITDKAVAQKILTREQAEDFISGKWRK